jgi:hypothetical protein
MVPLAASVCIERDCIALLSWPGRKPWDRSGRKNVGDTVGKQGDRILISVNFKRRSGQDCGLFGFHRYRQSGARAVSGVDYERLRPSTDGGRNLSVDLRCAYVADERGLAADCHGRAV